MNPKIDNYLLVGCGRCPLGGTPDCKVHNWQAELELLRSIALDSGLTEELKWGVPCYSYQKGNLLIISAFKAYCSISFFKGALLPDPKKILVKPGENSQAARLIKFKNVKEVMALKSDINAYIQAAINIEKEGLKVKFKKTPEPIPEELSIKMNESPELKKAFEALTPGRQRGYLLHFSKAKQSKTRTARIEKCMDRMLNGKGLMDR